MNYVNNLEPHFRHRQDTLNKCITIRCDNYLSKEPLFRLDLDGDSGKKVEKAIDFLKNSPQTRCCDGNEFLIEQMSAVEEVSEIAEITKTVSNPNIEISDLPQARSSLEDGHITDTNVEAVVDAKEEFKFNVDEASDIQSVAVVEEYSDQPNSNKTSLDTNYSIADEKLRQLINTAADPLNAQPDYFDFPKFHEENTPVSAKPSIDTDHLSRLPFNDH